MDRVDVSHTVDQFNVFGCGFAFATSAALARARIQALYTSHRVAVAERAVPTFLLERSKGPRSAVWSLHRDDDLLEVADSPSSALRVTEARICERILNHSTAGLWIHSGLVAGPAGAALLAGLSGAGKSTLSLSLAAHGLRVWGDDLTRLDPETLVALPAPRCFHLDARSRRLLRGVGVRLPRGRYGFYTTDDVGGEATRIPPVRLIVIVEPGPGDRSPVARPIVQAEMLTRLSEHVYGCTERGRLSSLGRLVSGARCYRLTRGDLGETSALVARLLKSASEAPPAGSIQPGSLPEVRDLEELLGTVRREVLTPPARSK